MSTGKLIQHLTSKHKDLATERINSNANEGGLVPLNPNDNKESENITLLRMMLECNLPLSFVEKNGTEYIHNLSMLRFSREHA